MSDDPRVHDALTRVADDAPAGDALWETTQRRIARRRRRRAIVVGVAAVLAVALGGATVAAVARGDDDGPNVAAEPPAPTAPDHVVAVVNGRLVVLSTNDDSSRAIPRIDGSQSVAEVSAVPGGNALVYTANYAASPGCSGTPKLIGANADGSAPKMLVGASMHSPLVSPDGSSVAYEMRECGAVGDVGITTLPPRVENFRFAVPGERPLAWTLDSKRLLVVQGEGEYSLAYVPFGNDRTHPPLPAGAHAAAFISDSEVALAITQPGVGEEIATYDLAGGNKRELMTIRDYVVTTMSYDPTSGLLLVVATDQNGNGSMSFVRQGKAETRIVHGLTAAAWYDPPQVAAHDTSSTVPMTTSTTAPVSPQTTAVAITTPVTLPPAEGFAGLTEWSPIDQSTLGETFMANALSPQAKVDAMVAAFLAQPVEGRRDARGVVAAIDGNAALIEVRVVGFADDSVGGQEYHLLLAHDAPANQWRVAAVESRSLCLRGVDQASNLCV